MRRLLQRRASLARPRRAAAALAARLQLAHLIDPAAGAIAIDAGGGEIADPGEAPARRRRSPRDAGRAPDRPASSGGTELNRCVAASSKPRPARPIGRSRSNRCASMPSAAQLAPVSRGCGRCQLTRQPWASRLARQESGAVAQPEAEQMRRMPISTQRVWPAPFGCLQIAAGRRKVRRSDNGPVFECKRCVLWSSLVSACMAVFCGGGHFCRWRSTTRRNTRPAWCWLDRDPAGALDSAVAVGKAGRRRCGAPLQGAGPDPHRRGRRTALWSWSGWPRRCRRSRRRWRRNCSPRPARPGSGPAIRSARSMPRTRG